MSDVCLFTWTRRTLRLGGALMADVDVLLGEGLEAQRSKGHVLSWQHPLVQCRWCHTPFVGKIKLCSKLYLNSGLSHQGDFERTTGNSFYF